MLVKAGAFDGVGDMHRAQYFYKENENASTYLEQIVRWGVRWHEGEAASQMSIFDMSSELAQEAHPPVPKAEPWNNIERCRYEKEVISTYLSGHPLDDYKYEMQLLVNTPVAALSNLEALSGRTVSFAGMVSNAKKLVSQKGEGFGMMTIDDYSGSYELKLYGDDYVSHSGHFENNTFVFCRANIFTREYIDKKTGSPRSFTKMNITAMMSLASVLDHYTNKLAFNVQLSDVTEEFCRNLEHVALEHQGKVPLQVTVVDPVRNLSLGFSTSKYKVAVHDLLPELERIRGVFNIKPSFRG